MAYTSDKKSTGLETLTQATLTQSDLHIVGDVSDSGRAKAITENELEDYIANSTNFIDELVANNYFITELISAGGTDNYTVKATSADTTPSFLDNKINIHSSDSSVSVTKTVTNPAGNEIVDYDLTVTGGGGGGNFAKRIYATGTYPTNPGQSFTIAHGLGTTPGSMQIRLQIAALAGSNLRIASDGFSDFSGTNNCYYNGTAVGPTPTAGISTSYCSIYQDGPNSSYFELTATADATNITLTNSGGSSGTGAGYAFVIDLFN